MTKLLDKLIQNTNKYWNKYINHEFGKKIEDSSLDLESYKEYLIQDYYFLLEYARAWHLAGAKANNFKELNIVQEHTSAIVDGEIELHKNLIKKYNINPNEIIPSTECKQYTNYLIKIGKTGDFLDSLISLFGCPVGYYLLAKKLTIKNNIHPEYKAWINEYKSKEFEKSALRLIDKVNEYSNQVDGSKYKKLQLIFDKIAILEDNFFNQVLLDEKNLLNNCWIWFFWWSRHSGWYKINKC